MTAPHRNRRWPSAPAVAMALTVAEIPLGGCRARALGHRFLASR